MLVSSEYLFVPVRLSHPGVRLISTC
jgi:hypothetical protein